MNSNSFCNITMNKNTGRMHILCTMAFNSMVRGFPNVRFEKRRGIWVAPIIRRNAEHLLLRLVKVPGVTVEQEVLDAAHLAMDSVAAKRTELFPQNYIFKTTPYPHQTDAYNFAWSQELIAFFMEMGTGKTKTAIDLATARFMAKQIESVVVFSPVPIRSNWVAEFGVHCPVRTAIYVCDTTTSSFKKESQRFLDFKHPDMLKVLIVGIESFSQGLKKGNAYEYLMKYVRTHRSMQVVDESHKIKGHDANRAKNIEFIGMEDKYKAILTGTPVIQGLTDLYQQFQYLSPDIIGLGDFMSFRNRYCDMGGFQNKQMVGFKNEEELMEIIKPFVFQVKKEDVLKDLPPKSFIKYSVPLSPEQKKVYLDIKKKKQADLSHLISQKGGMDKEEFVELFCENVLSAYLALQQITAGFVTFWNVTDEGRKRETVEIVAPDKNPKIKVLLEFIEDSPGKPMIIWARFRKEIADIVQVLTEKYGEHNVVQYHGGMDVAERDVAKAKFLQDDGPLFFVSNQVTGGTGLTLNRSDRVWYQSNTFALVDRMQSEDRNHRIGQKQAVVYADCEAENTVDGAITAALASKMDVASYVRSRMERSPDDLLKLITDI